MIDVTWMSARAQRAAIASRAVSVAEMVKAHLMRISQINPTVNALVTLDPANAEKLAARYDNEAHLGPIPPLRGLPVTIKDLGPVEGMRSTNGSRVFENEVGRFDSTIARNFRTAGAVIVGRSNTSEFGCKPRTDNALFGITRNPWNLALSSGGSSGGAAAAVASGMCPIAEGSDLGGSVRHPAAWCGVVGFKPTPGIIPRWPNRSAWNAIGVNGCIARNVADARLGFHSMASFDTKDPLSHLAQQPKENRQRLKGLRIAYTPDLGGVAKIQPAILKEFAQVIQGLKAIGLNLFEESPRFEDQRETYLTLTSVHRFAAIGDLVSGREAELDLHLQSRIQTITTLSARDVAEAERRRTSHHQVLAEFFARFDLLLTPATATLPRPVHEYWPFEVEGVRFDSSLDELQLNFAFNLSNAPAISVPAGWIGELPFGLQLVAPWHQDDALLDWAEELEAILSIEQRRPNLG